MSIIAVYAEEPEEQGTLMIGKSEQFAIDSDHAMKQSMCGGWWDRERERERERGERERESFI